MFMPVKFFRTVAGGVAWTADTVPATGTQPGASGVQPDNFIPIRPRDVVGWAPHRLVVGVGGFASCQAYLAADLYAFERNSGLYLKTHDSTKMLRVGRTNYFDITHLAEPPVKLSNLDQGMTGGTDLLLIVQPPTVVTNGTYTFVMGADLTSLGTEEPNADDEANGLQAVTFSDGSPATSMPYGACRWLWSSDATAGHAIKVLTVDGDTQTITMPAYAGKIPVRAQQVFATGTTATAGSILAAY
jgi:hypothetical protein